MRQPFSEEISVKPAFASSLAGCERELHLHVHKGVARHSATTRFQFVANSDPAGLTGRAVPDSL